MPGGHARSGWFDVVMRRLVAGWARILSAWVGMQIEEDHTESRFSMQGNPSKYAEP
jgi:hypothetical protein